MSTTADFPCSICGTECLKPDDGVLAVCEVHCPKHQYVYDNWRCDYFCERCDKLKPLSPARDAGEAENRRTLK